MQEPCPPNSGSSNERRSSLNRALRERSAHNAWVQQVLSFLLPALPSPHPLPRNNLPILGTSPLLPPSSIASTFSRTPPRSSTPWAWPRTSLSVTKPHPISASGRTAAPPSKPPFAARSGSNVCPNAALSRHAPFRSWTAAPSPSRKSFLKAGPGSRSPPTCTARPALRPPDDPPCSRPSGTSYPPPGPPRTSRRVASVWRNGGLLFSPTTPSPRENAWSWGTCITRRVTPCCRSGKPSLAGWSGTACEPSTTSKPAKTSTPPALGSPATRAAA